jgi:disulfide bond formation protein DsbB
MFDRRQKLNLAGAAICAAMFGFAIFAEKVWNYVPCPLCMFQRVCIVALGVVFLVAGLHRAGRIWSGVYALLIFVAAGATTWVAGRHVWIQHPPYGTVPSCGAPLDALVEMVPLLDVIKQVMTGGGECGVIDWTFLGLSMPEWVLGMAVLLGLAGIANNLVRTPRSA